MKPRSHFSDYLIAVTVVLCALALLAAMAFALTGYHWQKAGPTLQVDFPNVAGIHRHSPVRYAGAPAGVVADMRLLTAAERESNPDPANAVRVTVLLDEGLPPIPKDVVACLGSDTLLSEKFVALDAGTAGGTTLADGAVVQGLSSPTFDDLMRHGGDMVHSVEQMLPAVKQDIANLIPKISSLATAGQDMATDAKAMLAKLSKILDSTEKMLNSTEPELHKSLAQIPTVLDHLDDLLKRTKGVISSNEKELASTLHDLHVFIEDMRVVATYAKILTHDLAEKPSRLVWGSKPAPVPGEQQILKSRGPVPLPQSSTR